MSRFCRHADESLPAYREGSLPPRRQRQVEEHLHACFECRQRLEALDRATAALERLRPAAPPGGMLDAFHERLAAESQVARPAPPRPRPVWMGAGLATTAALTAALWFHPGSPTHGPAAVATRAALVDSYSPVRQTPVSSDRIRAGGIATRVEQEPVHAPEAGIRAPHARATRHRSLRVATRHGRQDLPAEARPAWQEVSVLTRPAPRPPSMTPPTQPIAAGGSPTRMGDTATMPAAPARVEITARTVALIDPDTGESRQLLVARTVDAKSGKVHVTLSNTAPTAIEDEGTNDG